MCVHVRMYAFVCLCVCVWVWHVEIKGQLVGVGSLLPQCGSWGVKLRLPVSRLGSGSLTA